MTWPIYDKGEQVDTPFGSYVQTIVSGATDDAEIYDVPYAMVVERDEWADDYSWRVIYKLKGYGPVP